MSTVMVITPIVIASWPAITAAVAAAVGTIGFTAVQEFEVDRERASAGNARAEIEVEDSEILPDAGGSAEEIVVERDGIVARFSRDARGALRVCVEGRGH